MHIHPSLFPQCALNKLLTEIHNFASGTDREAGEKILRQDLQSHSEFCAADVR
jgi:hypothetical protein